MADEADETEDAAPKSRGKGLVIAAVGAIVAGGGGFFAAYAGFLDSLTGGGGGHADSHVESEMKMAFLPLDPLIISLGPEARSRTLRFSAQLEIEPESEAAVTALKPRIADVLNSYLRAVDEAELEDPAALALLRAQMLRRIQIVVGEGQVRDLLVLEFILS